MNTYTALVELYWQMKIYPIATFSTINSHMYGLGANPRSRADRRAINNLRHGTADSALNSELLPF